MPKQRLAPNPNSPGLLPGQVKNEQVLKLMAFGRGEALFHNTLEELDQKLELARSRETQYQQLLREYEAGRIGDEDLPPTPEDNLPTVLELETLINALVARQSYLALVEAPA